MLKALRYDFYKIFKSKALLGVFVASVCLSFLDSFLVGFYYNDTCLFQHLNAPMLVRYLPAVFTVPFACKDFSSKFTKNVFPEYSLKDKICYVLSKAVYIFAVNLIWYILFFLSYYAFVSLRCHIQNVPFAFEWVSYDGTLVVSQPEGIIIYFCVIINAFAVEMVLLFLSVLMKKEYLVLVLFFLYCELAPSMYYAINAAMGIEEFGFCRIQWFTVFGIRNELSGLPFGEKELRIPGYTRSIFISLGYSVLFCFLSFFVVSAKGTFKAKQTIRKSTRA